VIIILATVTIAVAIAVAVAVAVAVVVVVVVVVVFAVIVIVGRATQRYSERVDDSEHLCSLATPPPSLESHSPCRGIV
jgi:hypothetical protein